MSGHETSIPKLVLVSSHHKKEKKTSDGTIDLNDSHADGSKRYRHFRG